MPAYVRTALAAAAVWSLVASGCASLPRIDPTGERILTWEPQLTPVVSGPPLSPSAVALPALVAPGLTLTPGRIIAPVGSEVLMVAGVHGPGQPNVAGQRVEWMLAPGSVGHFLAVGESERPRILRLTPPPQKVSNDYAVSETQSTPRIITRGTLDPADDVSVLPGQAWVTVASPVEGSSHVTAFAPDIQGVLANRQLGVIHWVDVRWLAPTSSQIRIGEKHALVTSVTRASTGAPIAGYKVRYEVAGGAPAGFGPDLSGGVELTTNEQGQASAELGQAAAQAGVTQVNVQIVRPASPTMPGEPLVIGSTTMTVDWLPLAQPGVISPPVQAPTPGAVEVPAGPPTTPMPAQPTPPGATTSGATAPGLEVRVTGPTQEIAVGEQAEFRIEITNRSATIMRNVIVLDRFGSGLTHAVAPSPIRRSIGELSPGETRPIGLTFTVRQPGRHCHSIEVTADGGLRATGEGCVTASGVAAEAAKQPSIKLSHTGPAQMKVGETALFKIQVTNTSAEPLAGLRVSTTWRGGLQARQATEGNTPSGDKEINWKYDKPLARNASVIFEVQYSAQSAGPDSCASATAVVGSETVAAEHCVEITGATPTAVFPDRLSVILSDRVDPVPVGTPFSYRIVLRNDGGNVQRNVALVVELPESLDLESVQAPVKTEQLKAPTLRFPPVLRLDPKQLVSFELRVIARRAGRLVIRAAATSEAITQPVVAEEDSNVFEQGALPGSKGGVSVKE